jgi:hypothetical protein
MFQAALVPNAVAQHLSRNHLSVLTRLFIPSKFIAFRIRDRVPPAHDDIEKIS